MTSIETAIGSTLRHHAMGPRSIVSTERLLIDFLGGDVSSAIILSRIAFWDFQSKEMGRDGWFYKSYKDWQTEIGIKEKTCRRVIQRLKDLGILYTWVAKVDGITTLHYRFLTDIFDEQYGTFVQGNSGTAKREVRERPKGKFPLSKTVLTGSIDKEEHTVEKLLVDSSDVQIQKSSKPESNSNSTPKNRISSSNPADLLTHPKRKDHPVVANGHRNGVQAKPDPSTRKARLSAPTKSFNRHPGFDIRNTEEQTKIPKMTKLETATRKLHVILVDNHRTVRKANYISWLKEIKALIVSEEISPNDFSELVDWYCEHSEDEYMPQIYSATTFCKKYYQLQKTRKKQEREITQNTNLDISDIEASVNTTNNERGSHVRNIEQEQYERKMRERFTNGK